MRILVLSSTFPRWEKDRIPTFILELCISLSKEHEIYVLAPHYKDTPTHEIYHGLNVTRFRYAPEAAENIAYDDGINTNLRKNKILYFLLPFFFLSNAYNIYRITKQHNIDAIHCHWIIPQGIAFYLAKPFIANRIFSLCTVHGGDLYTSNSIFLRFLKKYILKSFHHVCYVSNALATDTKTILGFSSANKCIAPMGVDLKGLFKPNSNKYRNPMQICYAGRLVEKKGVEIAIEAMKIVLEKRSNIQLLIAGDGPLYTDLVKKTRALHLDKSIVFLGHLDHCELSKIFQTSAIAIFPFKKSLDGDLEGLGLTPIEAMGSGCAVITSNISATKDYLINGTTGLHFNEGCPVSLADKIQLLLQDKVLRNQLSKNGQKYVQRFFSWENVGSNYSYIFKKNIKE
jgi:glycosyltransferase involved in cell wall biosynthesis